MDNQNLIDMANRIGDFFDSMPDREEALAAVELDHRALGARLRAGDRPARHEVAGADRADFRVFFDASTLVLGPFALEVEAVAAGQVGVLLRGGIGGDDHAAVGADSLGIGEVEVAFVDRSEHHLAGDFHGVHGSQGFFQPGGIASSDCAEDSFLAGLGFARFAASGLAIMFGVQAAINISVNLQLIPAKGMTLPFISYGGSSIVSLAYGVGMLLALTRLRPRTEILSMGAADAQASYA